MNAEQFAYWLQGFVELNPSPQPSSEQWESIKQHLQTVFIKVTPQLGTHTSTPGVRSSEFTQQDRLREALRGLHYPGVIPQITC